MFDALYNLAGGSLSKIYIIFFLAFSGYLIRNTLILVGQVWVKAYHHTAVFLLLPCIAYVISSIIADNIALSLGMIGALSIVRFRNPVKSPFELVMFFALLTLGITASVSVKWLALLVLVILITLIFIEIIQYIYSKFNNEFYTMSFNEGVELNVLEIEASDQISFIENSNFLKSYVHDKENMKCFYKLGFKSRTELNSFKKQINKYKNLNRIDINYCN